jgi:hypothetical protein
MPGPGWRVAPLKWRTTRDEALSASSVRPPEGAKLGPGYMTSAKACWGEFTPDAFRMDQRSVQATLADR